MLNLDSRCEAVARSSFAARQDRGVGRALYWEAVLWVVP